MANYEALTNKVRAMVELEDGGYDVVPSGAGTNSVDALGFKASEDGILLFDNTEITNLDTSTVEINPLTGVFTKRKMLIGRQLWNFTATTYLQGSGTTTFPVRFNDLITSCALLETVGSASVSYTPISSDFKSCRIAVDVDGLKRYLTGAYGTFTMSGSAGQGIQVQFTHQGIYAAAPSSAAGAPDFSNFAAGSNTPVTMKSADLQIHPYTNYADSAQGTAWTTSTGTYPLVFKSFNFDRGVTLGERLDANHAAGMRGICITDAAPTLELVVEAKTTVNSGGIPDFWGDLASGYSHEVTFQHGTSSGNKWLFNFPYSQLTNVQENSGDAGIRNWTLSYRVQSGTDNTEFRLSSL